MTEPSEVVAPAEDNELAIALTTRFLNGVLTGEWKVISLGTASALHCGQQLAEELGCSDDDRLILLIVVAKS